MTQQRLGIHLILSLWLVASLIAPAGLVSAAPRAQAPPEPTPPALAPAPTPRVAAPAPDLRTLLASMSVADKVGQLFLITVPGRAVTPDSATAILVRDLRVGGVLLLPTNDNYRNIPVEVTAADALGQTETLNTAQQIATLADGLQALAFSAPQPPITPTAAITITPAVTPALSAAATSTPPGPATAGAGIPLWIAVDWPGDDSSFFAGTGGFTPLPSAMALGAGWNPALAEQTGQVVGAELRAAGVNLLLGPTLDVLDEPRPGSQGDLGTRTFGGDPFWVGLLGQAFIRGVQTGSANAVITAAKHFPGQGGSDRRPEDEVPTVQRPLQQLRQVELAPFAAVAASGNLQTPGITSALLTSHIRYRGLQASIREVTPPISLAPQLQDLMNLKEFADWRAGGGILISEALGVPALRRYYDPTLTKFPHRQVAQDAFLAGNDILNLGQFALTDDWDAQFAAIKETILFFQEKYRTDDTFRARVDASVERILRLKLRVYAEGWQADAWQRDLPALGQTSEAHRAVIAAVARAGLTLVYPGHDELADRIPSAPLRDERILIFTDARVVSECAACPPTEVMGTTALQEIILRLYGPAASGQIEADQVRSLTFADLTRYLAAAPGAEPETETAIAQARWLIFAQLDDAPETYPESMALHTFLGRRSDGLRDKRLVVFGFSAPYYLDTTEISKLTAYFGVYSHTAPFLEAAIRALFREFNPIGAPPVTVAGINYELIRQLEPAPGQIIALNPVGSGDVITRSIQVGSQIDLETGIILDRKGHPVPDGTLVEFNLRYPAESLALAPKVETTVAGQARTAINLDRAGELWITARAGEATESTRIEVKVGGDAPGSIATVVPTPTPEPLPTATITPILTQTPPPTLTAAPATPAPGDRLVIAPTPRRVNATAFFWGVLGAGVAATLAFRLRWHRERRARGVSGDLLPALAAALWAIVGGWIAYLLYALGWLPGATSLQAQGNAWLAGAVTLFGGALSLIWTARPPQEPTT